MRVSHAEHRFPAPSSKLRASLSGTVLQTARTGYATEGALFILAQLSTDAVSALRKVWVLITLRASRSGTFLQRKDVVNQCLEFGGRFRKTVLGV